MSVPQKNKFNLNNIQKILKLKKKEKTKKSQYFIEKYIYILLK